MTVFLRKLPVLLLIAFLMQAASPVAAEVPGFGSLASPMSVRSPYLIAAASDDEIEADDPLLDEIEIESEMEGAPRDDEIDIFFEPPEARPDLSLVRRPLFSHKPHTGTGCDQCHRNVHEREPAPMPKIEKCFECHKELKFRTFTAETWEKRAASPEAGSTLAADPALADKLDIRMGSGTGSRAIFTHESHVPTEGGDCLKCHAKIPESDAVGLETLPKAETCAPCHADRMQVGACTPCHGPGFKPSNHGPAWTRTHGPVSETQFGVHGSNCTACHKGGTGCRACHATEQPRDHVGFFKQRGHGFAAGGDRGRCLVCHRNDFCIDCHSSRRPISHRGPWVRFHGGAAPSRGVGECGVCHRADYCADCHRKWGKR